MASLVAPSRHHKPLRDSEHNAQMQYLWHLYMSLIHIHKELKRLLGSFNKHIFNSLSLLIYLLL